MDVESPEDPKLRRSTLNVWAPVNHGWWVGNFEEQRNQPVGACVDDRTWPSLYSHIDWTHLPEPHFMRKLVAEDTRTLAFNMYHPSWTRQIPFQRTSVTRWAPSCCPSSKANFSSWEALWNTRRPGRYSYSLVDGEPRSLDFPNQMIEYGSWLLINVGWCGYRYEHWLAIPITITYYNIL